jgi:hypothetical protein
MHYWLVLARLFEPLQYLEEDLVLAVSLSSFVNKAGNKPSELVARAKICIRTLLRLNYGSHGGEGYDLFTVLLSQYVGFGLLSHIAVPCASSTDAARAAYESDVILSARI